jgi:small subunit ribosomal protein S21
VMRCIPASGWRAAEKPQPLATTTSAPFLGGLVVPLAMQAAARLNVPALRSAAAYFSLVAVPIIWSPVRVGRKGLAEVRLREGETLEDALRRFKRKVLQEGIIQEVRRRAFYLKPGQKRRLKQVLARKRNRKKSRRDFE